MTAVSRRWKALKDVVPACSRIPWRTLPRYEHLDPYLAWADASGSIGGVSDLRLLVRLAAPGGAARPQQRYFFAGSVPSQDVLRWRPGLVVSGGVPGVNFELDIATQLALPRPDAGPRVQSLVSALNPDATESFAAGGPPLIAIVDDGCPFAHAGYLRGSGPGIQTRVRDLWDQSPCAPAAAAPWQSTGVPYGRRIEGAALDRIISRHQAADGAIDEDACYKDADLGRLIGASVTHGAQVMGLAAAQLPGNPDAAGRADLIFVQLPQATMRDTSGGSLGAQVLDALHYIDERRQTVAPGGGKLRRPVVVNLSLGAAAGPHDGTSLIELAIDDFVRSRPGMVVLLAAGNARGRGMRGSLALAAGETARIGWVLPPDSTADAFAELWAPSQDDSGEAPRLHARLVPPDEPPDPAAWAAPGEVRCLQDAGGGPAVAAVVSALLSTGSLTGQQILAAVARTSESNGAVVAPAGRWTLEVENLGGDVRIDAWIERADASFGGNARQSVFDVSGGPLATGTDATLSSLAMGRETVVVGGDVGVGDPSAPRRPAPTSGEGPGRAGLGSRAGPDFVAPCAIDRAGLVGLLTPGVHTGQWLRMQGTSAACAVATRSVFNLWTAQPALAGRRDETLAALPLLRPAVGDALTRVGRGYLDVHPPWDDLTT